MAVANEQETGINTEKFMGVMRSIEKSLIGQNRILSDLGRTLKASREAAQDQMETKTRTETLDKLKTPKPEQKESPSVLDMLKGKFAAVGGNVKGNLNLESGLLLLASPFILDFMSGFFSGIIDKIQDGSLGNSIMSNLDWSAIAIAGGFLIGGKKFLLSYAILSAVMGSLTNWFEDTTGLDVPDVVNDPTTIAALALLVPSLMGWLIKSIAKKLVVAPALALGNLIWRRVSGQAAVAAGEVGTKAAIGSGTTQVTEKAIGEAAEKRVAAQALIAEADNAAAIAAKEAAERTAAAQAAKQAVIKSLSESELALRSFLESGPKQGLQLYGDKIRRIGGQFASSAEKQAAAQALITAGKTTATQTAERSAMGGIGSALSKIGLKGLRLLASGPALAAQLAVDPTFEPLSQDPQEELLTWINNQFKQSGGAAIPQVQGVLNSQIGQQLREQFGSVYPEFNQLLDTKYAQQYAAQQYDYTAKPLAAVGTSSMFYGDSNALLNKMITSYTTNAEGFSLDKGAISAKLASEIAAAAGNASKGYGASPALISSSNNGNVTRGGDTNVSNTTNIYGVTPAKALNEGNSVPRPYYANQ